MHEREKSSPQPQGPPPSTEKRRTLYEWRTGNQVYPFFWSSSTRLEYGEHPAQYGQLYVPRGSGPHPVAVVIHGGIWLSVNGLDYMDGFCTALMEMGIAAWNIEYRRLGDEGGGWPGTFRDVVAAMEHLPVLAATRALDLEHVMVIGHSSGGHLALWVAGQQRLPKDHPLYAPLPFRLGSVTALAAVTDLRRASELGSDWAPVAHLLGGKPDEVPDRYKASSPIDMVPLGLRQIVVHGMRDELVPYEMSDRYFAAATAAGDPVRLISLEEARHFDLIDPESAAWPRVREAIQLELARR